MERVLVHICLCKCMQIRSALLLLCPMARPGFNPGKRACFPFNAENIKESNRSHIL